MTASATIDHEEHRATESFSDVKAPDLTANRIHFLDGLRALTAVYVVLHHAWLQVWSEFRPPAVGIEQYYPSLFRYGHYAVDIFIVISGLSLMLGLARHNYMYPGGIKRFYLKRVCRIVPPFYAAIAISGLLATSVISQKLGTHYDCCVPVYPQSVIGCFQLLPELNGSSGNHSFWSIGVECKIYLLFPLLLWILRGMGPVFLLSFSSVLGLISWWLVQRTVYLGTFPHYVALFCCGMGASYFVSRYSSAVFEKYKVTLLVAAAWALFAYMSATGESLRNTAQIDIALGFAMMGTLMLLASGKITWLYKLCCTKVMSAIGVFSYSLYLIHAPLLQVFSKYISIPLHLPRMTEYSLFVGVGLPLILVLSYAFYLVFERPCLERAKRF